MKKLFVCALAVGMFTACSQDETISQQSPVQISFEGAYVNNASRADVSADPSTTTETLTGFDVWAFMDTPDGVMLTGDDVEGVKGNFTYAHTQYWIAGHQFYFSALAPMNSANAKVTTDPTKGADKYGLGTVEFTNVNGTEDLLYSATMVEVAKNADLSDMASVEFTFNHLLSKVKFTFKNTFTNPNYNFEVRDIKMVVPSKGTINLNQEDWWSTNEWELGEGTTTLAFGTTGNIAQGKEQECADERLTIPAEAAQTYEITFTVDLYTGAVLAETYDHKITLTGAKFEIGKAYDLYAELNGNNIDQEGALNPIVFDVEEVLNWVEGDAYGVGTNVATVADLEAALAEGGEVILTEDMELTKALTITEDVTLYLNGHNIIAPSCDAIIVDNGATVTITGNGDVKAATDENSSANALWVKHGNVTINGGNWYVGADGDSRNDCIYVGAAAYVADAATKISHLTITGGTFEAAKECPEQGGYWVLNLRDEFYKAGSTISVIGGKYKNFDPANNLSEGAGTNFVDPDYKSVANGEYFEVVKK